MATDELQLANERLLRRRAEWLASRRHAAAINFGSPLSPLLKQTLTAWRQERRRCRVDEIDAYTAAWLRINEATVRDATVKVIYRNGFLTITVANPTLKTELASFLAEPLLANLRQELPAVNLRGLKFKCGVKTVND
ncbi:hypothetical protein FACS1894139_07230 [Planctomycetales bacterium]|nr:hypothetical protein FACS1894107_11760 [Planctomycetales bacterium]GHT00881.1 hypothetical protein FACS1894108_13940 [Planctomycetales bacterium]GHT04683.1 hypothetical protein FACS1894139_07230 [Planctomycetales bacterium]